MRFEVTVAYAPAAKALAEHLDTMCSSVTAVEIEPGVAGDRVIAVTPQISAATKERIMCYAEAFIAGWHAHK